MGRHHVEAGLEYHDAAALSDPPPRIDHFLAADVHA
jgi:hypothetical protein